MYQVVIHPSEYGNAEFKIELDLTDDQLESLVVLATGLFDVHRDEVFEIHSGTKRVDCQKIFDRSEAVVYDGEAAFVLEPEVGIDWLDKVDEVGDEHGEEVEVDAKYTLKLETERPMLLQFDSCSYLSGMYGLCDWMKLPKGNYLKYLHSGDDPLELP